MNPLTNVKNINKLNEIELTKGLVDKKSWHDIYKDSAWIFIGGLAYGLTEGDILCVFSQYGEIVNLNLVRDKKTGKTKGFCFLCYANQKSTILAVDNLNGIKLCGRTIRVDHVANYKPPKDNEHDDELTKQLKEEGCAPRPIKLEKSPSPPENAKKMKKAKKDKKKHKKKKKKNDDGSVKRKKIKKEKHDPGYDKYELHPNQQTDSSSSDSSDDDSYLRNGLESRLRTYDRRMEENSNQPGTSGYQESKKKSESKRTLENYKHKNSENYYDKEKAKKRRIETFDEEDGRRDKPSKSSHDITKQSSSQSFSSDSSDNYSSSKDRTKTKSNYKLAQKSKSHENSHKESHRSNRHDSSRSNRHDSPSSNDSSPSRPVQRKSKEHSINYSKHEKHFQERSASYRDSDFSHDRKYTERSHKYDDRYKKHSSSNSNNGDKSESHEKSRNSNGSHYDSRRNKE